MQLLCPSCGALISPDDISSDRALAICRACKTVTSLDRFGSQEVGTRVPPSSVRRRRQEIPRPNHISIKNNSRSLCIRFRWIWDSFTGSAVMCFLWGCGIGFYYWIFLGIGGRPMWLAFIWSTPHVVIGLKLVYVALAGLLNHTIIKITSEFLTIRHGSIPWPGNRNFHINDLKLLYCRKDTAPEKRDWTYVYRVSALTMEGSRLDLTGSDKTPSS